MDIAQLLDPNLIKFEIESDDKWGAITELAELLFKNNRIESQEKLLEAVRRREAEVSTGVGFGIAIPHGISDTVIQPAIVFGRSRTGIDYNSIDQKPVNLIFLFAIPKSNYSQDYLRTLAKLARLLVHQSVLDKLYNASSFDEILDIFQDKETPLS
jgi:fructose-specific phosphotransferase system IIA component